MTQDAEPTSHAAGAEDRRARREAALDALREAASLRARLNPRAHRLARARALLHNRTTRG